MNYDKLINFRWGSEPQRDIKRKSLARKWMFIKPDVGNLSAAAQVPFSSFNVIPYFGGYPSGFSFYEYCAWGTPRSLASKTLKGFTHFSFSGAGDLHHFHNYFLIRPSKKNLKIYEENYSLNGFNIKTSAYRINTIVNARSVHYQISSLENVTLIPGFNGLSTKKYKSEIVKVKIIKNNDYINVFADYLCLKLFWSLKIIKGECLDITESEIILSKDVEFILAFSLISSQDANKQIALFNDKQAMNQWVKLFDVFDVKDDSTYRRLFYTALMFALKKPYIFDKNHIYDFATMWDIYKTLLPLIFLFYKKEASIIVNNMLKLVNKDGLFYHVNYFFNPGLALSDQAICLINISLSTACLYGVHFDKKRAMQLQKREIEYYLKHLKDLYRTTYLLDLCDAIVAYYNAYHIDLGLKKVKQLMDKAFEQDKVYLKKKAEYYEGNYSNYSFRVSSSTIYRLNNKAKLVAALDCFFGFIGDNTVRFVSPNVRISAIKRYMKHCKRFEGLNNEPDMESMYLYSYLGLYDKQNQIINDVISNSYSIKNNGVPGNDDNGALSSWLVFNLLGIFPVVGTDKIKIGLPFFKEVKAGNLTIKKHARNDDAINIEKVFLNDKLVTNNEITAKDIARGGILDIYLK